MPGTAFFLHEPFRQVRFFSLVDRLRLIEVHEALMNEAEGDLFREYGVDRWFPTLATRHRLPVLLSELGETDLAGRLFDRYHDSIVRYGWVHREFLENYIDFLISEGDYIQAENTLKSILQKSIRIDLRLLPRLYAEWGILDEWGSRTRDLHLSAGREALMRDWRSALAEGREMVEYSDIW